MQFEKRWQRRTLKLNLFRQFALFSVVWFGTSKYRKDGKGFNKLHQQFKASNGGKFLFFCALCVIFGVKWKQLKLLFDWPSPLTSKGFYANLIRANVFDGGFFFVYIVIRCSETGCWQSWGFIFLHFKLRVDAAEFFIGIWLIDQILAWREVRSWNFSKLFFFFLAILSALRSFPLPHLVCDSDDLGETHLRAKHLFGDMWGNGVYGRE